MIDNDYTFRPGDSMGNCVIQKPIGRGGFGEVYLARCRNISLALKLYTASLDYKDFFNEVRNMGLFNDKPYFVKFYGSSDIGSHYHYILMEYMEGGTLREKLWKGPLSMDDIITVLYSIAWALRYMHERDICHRDIAPENIFFDSIGSVKLGDLGFSAPTDSDRFPFREGYLVPEERDCKKGDIYQLGVTLYEMLGGEIYGVQDIWREIQKLPIPKGFDPQDFERLRFLLRDIYNPQPESHHSAKEVIREIEALLSEDQKTVFFEASHRTVKIEQSTTSFNFSQLLHHIAPYQQTFFNAWNQQKIFLFEGLDFYLQQSLEKAAFFSLSPYRIYLGDKRIDKRENYYVGLEHLLWALIEPNTIIYSLITGCSLDPSEITREIFLSVKSVRLEPDGGVVTPRLKKIIEKTREQFSGMGAITEKRLLSVLLEEDNISLYLLKSKGVNPMQIKRNLDEI